MSMDFSGLEECEQRFHQGLAIRPGMWRPQAPWEQVAWVHPPWYDQGHLWLDFPEVAIVNDEYFAYAGHGPVGHSLVRHGPLPASAWQPRDGGLTFERSLPCGLIISGSLATGAAGSMVTMELCARNDGAEVIHGLKMQTCAYLHELREFNAQSWSDKYIHVPQRGWINLTEASKIREETERYRFGWRGGPAIADWPVIAAVSAQDTRLIAMSWGRDTYSLISNPNHPCIHADPFFPDLAPGHSHRVRGWLRFFEGALNELSGEIEKQF